MIVQDFRKDLPRIQQVFQELGEASHLQLNYDKCVFIPLFEHEMQQVRMDLSAISAPMASMHIDPKCKYLGYTIGPGKGDNSWQGALIKAARRCQDWDWAPLGLFFATQVWNIYITSLFGFVAQLEPQPQGHQEPAGQAPQESRTRTT